MNIIKYPSEEDVNKAMAADEPLLAVMSFDGKTAIMSQIDEAMEHHILLMKAGYNINYAEIFLLTYISMRDKIIS